MTIKDDAQFGAEDAEIIRQEVGYRGFFRLLRVHLRHKLFKGGWSEEITRELFIRGHAAAVLPYDAVRDEIILVEQFRVGAIYEPGSPWLLEVVAGIVEEGETAEDVVHREAEEEAGLTLNKLIPISTYYPSPGGCSERISLFLGEVDASLAPRLGGLSDESEDIRVHRVPRQQAMQWMSEGKLDNASTIIALQWLALNREQVFN
ncbi:ADP-ribose diphosphatase [Oceanisphaera avium]|uniref:ADP-ribose pyrophosphatase n=1 Tax=Oceanisphaera avium TaxID=1903694 RepID=A0A1Y0CXV4_9GAMM|nr:ADP-ribose diphosphatase [Oceanisphaera avium]ART80142.1 ADP-ribose diphosphatase [Oceanisphaera avium]